MASGSKEEKSEGSAVTAQRPEARQQARGFKDKAEFLKPPPGTCLLHHTHSPPREPITMDLHTDEMATLIT